MNSAILLIPLFLVRYGLLTFINKKALPKAAHFAPMQGAGKIMYFTYQLSTVGIIFYMFFTKVANDTIFLEIGLVVYCLGVILLALSTISFAKQTGDGIVESGMYSFSRNPMYVGYFVYFLGCVALTKSIVLLLILCLFQISAHWVILAEERWCVKAFGEKYVRYMGRVRRYI